MTTYCPLCNAPQQWSKLTTKQCWYIWIYCFVPMRTNIFKHTYVHHCIYKFHSFRWNFVFGFFRSLNVIKYLVLIKVDQGESVLKYAYFFYVNTVFFFVVQCRWISILNNILNTPPHSSLIHSSFCHANCIPCITI